jgi:hypothetical protein
MAAWNPRPGEIDASRRKSYHAGYSDGFYAYRFGAGQEDPDSDYQRGYDDGKSDGLIKGTRS